MMKLADMKVAVAAVMERHGGKLRFTYQVKETVAYGHFGVFRDFGYVESWDVQFPAGVFAIMVQYFPAMGDVAVFVEHRTDANASIAESIESLFNKE